VPESLAGALRGFRRAPLVHVSRSISRVLDGLRMRIRRRDGHSSGTSVTRRLKQPTRTAGSGHRPRNHRARARRLRAVPIRSCSRWGLPCRRRYRRRGALLPHRFTLAAPPESGMAVCFLWHFPWARTRRMLSGTACPWSPDFPPRQPFGFAGAAVRPTDRYMDGGVSRPRQGPARSVALRTRAARVRARPRLARSSCSVLRVDGSAVPSTRSGRK
jgi:hypothetical protein